jgi:hypothetical protein
LERAQLEAEVAGRSHEGDGKEAGALCSITVAQYPRTEMIVGVVLLFAALGTLAMIEAVFGLILAGAWTKR